MSPATGAVRVVIVTYNSADLIAGCVDACLRAATKYKICISVVDNGSVDDTLDVLKELGSSVRVIRNVNRGFAHGCNTAIKDELEREEPCGTILFLNPDALLPEGAIDYLMNVLMSDALVGGVSPKVTEGPETSNLRTRTLLGRCMKSYAKHESAVITDRLHGACMLWRTEVIRTTGFFDERYFLYWEELDYSYRALASGHTLLLLNGIEVSHRWNQTERPHRIYFMWRNQFLFAAKNYPVFSRLVFWIGRVKSCSTELLGFLIGGRLDLVRAAFAGLIAGMRGEVGRGSCPLPGGSNQSGNGLLRK
jgi:GT2 family glycosyltransferase